MISHNIIMVWAWLCALALGAAPLTGCGDDDDDDEDTDTATDTGTETGGTDTQFDTDTETETMTDTGTETGTMTDTGTESVTETMTDTGTETGTMTDTGTESVDTVTETQTGTDTEDTATETDTDTGMDTSTDSESDMDTATTTGDNGTVTDTVTDTGTDTSTGTDSGTETDTDTGTDTESEQPQTVLNIELLDIVNVYFGIPFNMSDAAATFTTAEQRCEPTTEYTEETQYGDCVIPVLNVAQCDPECLEGQICAYEDETFTTRTCVDQFPVCDPDCGSEQQCAWNETCDAGVCEDITPVLSAGAITITGATDQPTVVATMTDQGYSFVAGGNNLNSMANWWVDDDTLTISAPGATFPEFSVELTAPLSIRAGDDLIGLTAADLEGGSDVPISWDVNGDVLVVVAAVNDDGGVRVVQNMVCNPSNPGELTLPADGLAAVSDLSGESPTSWTVTILRTVISQLDLSEEERVSIVGATLYSRTFVSGSM